ncbi:uncharacterized protein PFL1_06461 [Pseudozyma flocculosa PF-1]|uniref:Related to channel protein n=2 Tax=Pseudozyma flocculosa TaxID=84751 RepID=A0A5C3ETS3_9BASI|nr:uncharacterized protein PFL1_06461 [Pseudozyma flocculosa PF-1]EPQ26007.1 hypothetical protein PFL1_06461 [Pseudozyma flocculosa PF-1]SPO35688.1 related to channel protein [Pseudozyma flocculosa]
MSRPHSPAPGAQLAEDVAVAVHLNTDGASTPNSLSGMHLQLPENPRSSGDASDPATTTYALEPVNPKERVTVDVVKDAKSGKHYKAIPVKNPAYSLGHTKGAPAVAPLPPRTTGRIGLGHALPTKEQNDAYKKDKKLRSGRTSAGTHTPENYMSDSSRRPSMDANTSEGRNLLLQQLRELIHEEVSRANWHHSESVKQHLEESKQDQVDLLEEAIAKTKAQEDEKAGDLEKTADVDAPKMLMTETKDDSTVKGSDTSAVETVDPEYVERGVIERTGTDGTDGELEFPNPWAKFRYKMREPFAEFLGTFILMTFGDGINNQVFVSQMLDPSSPKGEYLSVSFGWGVGVALGVWVAGGISGGMLNPAVTITLATFRKFPWKKVPIYIAAQLLGSFCGALCIYGLYVNPIRMVDPLQTEKTAALFTTYPAEFLRTPSTRMTTFYNEIYASAVLLIVILAIGDASNTPPPDGMAPIALLWLVWGLGATLGWQTAYAVNPARDLGPRIMLSVVGYPSEILWTFDAWYWLWVPTLATIVGALIGAFIYDGLMYTGGESPLNAKWRFSSTRFGRGSKNKLPAALSEA